MMQLSYFCAASICYSNSINQSTFNENASDFPLVHHLAILNFQVTSMDWLALSKDGHRRARLTPFGVVNWLVP